MKKLVLLGLIGLINLNVYAESLPADVIIEHTTHMVFAPSRYLGIYKFQILSSGVVQKIDNTYKTTVVAELSPAVVHKIKMAIDSIRSDELSLPNGPICMDAPSKAVQVRQSNGVNMMIWKQMSCRDSEPLDNVARDVVRVMKNFENTFSMVDYLG